MVVKDEDVDAGFHIPLGGAQSPKGNDEHECICRTDTIMITPILQEY